MPVVMQPIQLPTQQAMQSYAPVPAPAVAAQQKPVDDGSVDMLVMIRKFLDAKKRDLTENTIDANARFFSSADEVPRQAVSMGIGTIMKARSVLLIATGADKAQAVRDALRGDITPQVQASILQSHPQVDFLLDREAAGMLASNQKQKCAQPLLKGRLQPSRTR